MGSAVRHGKTFSRAWDRFILAWPLSRVVVVLGAPLAPDAGALVLQNAIARANASAAEALDDSGAKLLASKKYSKSGGAA
jgi:lysophospholipid acyltransferase (LPLAT)-like uncharacterized protein